MSRCSYWNPKKFSITINGVPIKGLADGEFLSGDQRNDDVELVKGADGEGAFTESNDDSQLYTLTLLQGSLSNNYLSELQRTKAFVSFACRDENGTTVESASKCRIVKPATRGFAKTHGTRAWGILAHAAEELVVGGSNDV